jgi:hypothetical protein
LAELISVFENRNRLFESNDPIILSMICVFLITIKLSTAPILLLPIIWVLYKLIKKDYKLFAYFVLFSFVILLPYVVRNFIQTGYPVYPGFPLDIFHFDWALPVERVKDEAVVIHWFAMLSSTPLDDFLKMSFMDQFNNWFANLLPRYKAILKTISVGILFNIVLLIFKKWRSFMHENSGYFYGLLVFIVGDLFWFFSAPSIRFGYGFLLGSVFLVLFPIVLFMIKQLVKLQNIAIWFILAACIGLTLINFRTVIHYKDFSTVLLMPKEYPTWSSAPCEFHNFKLLCQADYDSCWYSPFPCAIRGNKDIEMRGSDYREGFRQVPKNE